VFVPRLNVRNEPLSINSFVKRPLWDEHCASVAGGYNDSIVFIPDGPNLEPSAASLEVTDGCPIPELINLKGAHLRLKADLRPQWEECDAA
jgi:hypothetical protein